MNRRTACAALLALLLSACGGGDPLPSQPKSITLIGDSVIEIHDWSIDLHGATNLGVSGQTTEQIAARMPQALASKPGIVVLNGGINDMGKNLYSAEHQKRAALDAMAAGATVVIIGIYAPPAWRQWYVDKVASWNTEMIAFSVENRITYIDNAGHMAGLLGPDQVHPNAQWYDMVTERIKEQQ